MSMRKYKRRRDEASAIYASWRTVYGPNARIIGWKGWVVVDGPVTIMGLR